MSVRWFDANGSRHLFYMWLICTLFAHLATAEPSTDYVQHVCSTQSWATEGRVIASLPELPHNAAWDKSKKPSIIIKNCSLSIVLTATDNKTAKIIKRWYYPPSHRLKVGGRPPSWICWARIGTAHDDHLVVSIVVQNLVEIDAVGLLSTIWNSIFRQFYLKKPIRAPKIGGLGNFTPKREQYQRSDL